MAGVLAAVVNVCSESRHPAEDTPRPFNAPEHVRGVSLSTFIPFFHSSSYTSTAKPGLKQGQPFPGIKEPRDKSWKLNSGWAEKDVPPFFVSQDVKHANSG